MREWMGYQPVLRAASPEQEREYAQEYEQEP